MKKLLYISSNNHGTHPSGVVKKIKMQLSAFEQSYNAVYWIHLKGLEVVCSYQGKDVVLGKVGNLLTGHSGVYKVVEQFIDDHKISNVYIRYMIGEFCFLRMLREIAGKCKIVIEVPTYPYYQEWKNTPPRYLAGLLDRVCCKKYKRYIQNVATYSQDKLIWGVPCLNVKNGIDYSQVLLRRASANREQIHLYAVATMYWWHGYDRMIAGMEKYYHNCQDREVHFHLIGEGTEMPEYRKMVQRAHLEQYIHFYGYQNSSKCAEIADKCSIAVASLGLHRAGLYSCSTLKTREYLAQGFPIVTACSIDVVPQDDPYLLTIPEDEQPVDIDSVIAFFDSVYFGMGKNPTEIAATIRENHRQECDMIKVLEPCIAALDREID